MLETRRLTEPSHVSRDIAIVCFSHLRWDFVFQRPQHIMSRFARDRRVFFIEEPQGGVAGSYEYVMTSEGVHRIVPSALHVPMQDVIHEVFARFGVRRFVSWYYTPAALQFSGDLLAEAVVYDCMDQLSAFKGADRRLPRLEAELLRRADVVFAGGRSLYENKAPLHPNVHLLPSSVDEAHFRKARDPQPDRIEHRNVGRPRAGYYGVIDERLDVELLDGVARLRPDWEFVIVGPVVKIDPSTLPLRDNIHYVGQRPYGELPSFLANWDVAMQPFAKNAATRYISPTKTLEYIAAGKRVVSTSIRDVVEPYGRQSVVAIADEPEAFGDALDAALKGKADPLWHAAVERILEHTSWDRTWEAMDGAIAKLIA